MENTTTLSFINTSCPNLFLVELLKILLSFNLLHLESESNNLGCATPKISYYSNTSIYANSQQVYKHRKFYNVIVTSNRNRNLDIIRTNYATSNLLPASKIWKWYYFCWEEHDSSIKILIMLVSKFSWK